MCFGLFLNPVHNCTNARRNGGTPAGLSLSLSLLRRLLRGLLRWRCVHSPIRIMAAPSLRHRHDDEVHDILAGSGRAFYGGIPLESVHHRL